MGCGPSKNAVSVTPALESSVAVRDHRRVERKKEEDGDRSRSEESGKGSKSFRLGNLIRYLEAEQIAAGWPVWLSSVAGEAIQGWVPLKAESFEKFEKIGQGTYSSVYKARDLDTGKIVALKKVRFDNFEPESVKFMAREIQILRRLDHPNVMKLEGLITSRLTCSMYLVFEYMEHDLAGLSSCPDIKFSESQIKCYMNQLLSGIDHCHSRGIIHRDIKCANLLINDEGILKIADFGLANFSNPGKQPLTSRVVTLWYRPPELLLGSTDYTSTVDIWSIGCVFAEMFLQKPIIQGKTEVEQLHKIFKLCGSPTEEYWKKTKLPHATIFKPHRPYESCLHETFKCLPDSAFRLLEILLSVEPDKRGTSSTALSSEYFKTEPYGCEPSSLPKYPPNKEIDANIREKLQRNMATGGTHEPEAIRRPLRTHRPSREPRLQSKLVARPEESKIKASAKGHNRLFVDIYPAAAIDHPTKNRRSRHDSHGDIPFSGPLNVPSSSGFAWAKRQSDDNPYIKVQNKCSSRDHHSDSKGQLNGEADDGAKVLEQDDQFDSSNVSHSRDWSQKHGTMGYQDQGDRIEFSGPLLSQSWKVDEHLEKHERQIRQAVRRSWFKRGQKLWFPV